MAAVVMRQDGFIGPRATGQGAQDATTPITAARSLPWSPALTEQRAGELLPVAIEMIERFAPAAPEAVKAEAVRAAGRMAFSQGSARHGARADRRHFAGPSVRICAPRQRL